MANVLGKAPTAIIEIPLNQILVDYDWNARNKSHVLRTVKANADSESVAGYEPTNETTGLGGGDKTEPGLVEDIKLKGQTDPGDVVFNTDPKTKEKFPYRLIAGFKRYTALVRIAEQGIGAKVENPILGTPHWKSSAPTMRVVIHEGMTNFGACLRNMAENTDRDNMSYQDFAFGVKRLLDAAKSEKIDGTGRNGEFTAEDAAVRLGVSRAYAFQAMAIMNNLPASVTGHWRNGGKVALGGIEISASKPPLGWNVMYALAQDVKKSEGKKDPEKFYAETVMNKAVATKGGNARKRAIESARAKCEELAQFLAWCDRRGFDLSSTPNKKFWDDLSELIVNDVSDDDAFVTLKSKGKNLTDNQREAIARGMENAYEEELKYDPKAEEDGGTEEEEETPKKGKKGKGSKVSNGAAAEA